MDVCQNGSSPPWLGRTVARRLRSPTAGKHANPVVLGVSAFIGALYGGYFGAGLGIILLALFSFVLPESLGRVIALKQIASLLANGAAAILFVATGNVVWSAAAIMAAGALLGGSLGGRFADKVRASTLRGMVIALGFAIALAFLFR